ncbi:unnamed protein product [Adineta steineri]|uniref:Vps41 beta-propeller domain-containing protein n=1 Tax=Adineta steineri TaxID=433720 RepID=A0A815DTD6_9BILA|nr:unnamed protein product [Adineta steineri]
MCADTNNSIENEEGDDNDEEAEEYEPVFKFCPITNSSEFRENKNNTKNAPAEFSCMAVHARFIVVGKTTGEIIIMDHMGHTIPQYQIKAHTYPVNAISIDDNGDYIGSCCQEGKVKISGLFSKNEDQLHTFPRPIKAVCLDPNFSKSKQYITGDTTLILNERGTFRHKETKLIDFQGGLIHTLRWKETLIAAANDKGVGVYDLRARRLVGFLESTDTNTDVPRGIFPSRISWNDSTTLVIAWASTVKVITITNDTMYEHQSSIPRKSINIAASFKLEFFVCGLTSINRDLVFLSIENFTISDGTSELSLTILSPSGKEYEEKAHDPFSMQGDQQTSPFQFQLEYLPDEQCFFILNPYSISKAERRDYDDHIDFLIKKQKFDEAIQAFEKPPTRIDAKPKRHTQQSVYLAYVTSLMGNKEIEKAVKLFPLVYKTAEEWEEQILLFIERDQLDMLTPYIPTDAPKLHAPIYQKILETYLQKKKYDKLKELLTKWPSDIYDLSVIDQSIILQTNSEKTPQALLECSAIIAEKRGDISKTLTIFLKMQNIQVFQLIERKQLYEKILPNIQTLMAINQNYLDAVFSRKPDDTRDFHTRQVSLYAEYEPTKLMGFLRKAGNYNIQEALSICEKKRLPRETVFLCGRSGNGRVALQIILNELNDIEEAIQFCRETGDKKLWDTLIEQSINRPDFIRGLLNHAGGDIDLQDLIDKVKDDLKIPGLRDSLCKIMQDYNIQMSISECCRKIIVHDCLALRKQTVTLLQGGYPVKDSDLCAKCHNPVYSCDLLTNPPISVFFCLHVFHAKCIETNPDVCGVCSTNALFTTA